VRAGYALNGLVSLDAQLDLDRPAYFAAIREDKRSDNGRGILARG
jgi:hypothetical protein